MDLVLSTCDDIFLDTVWQSSGLPRDSLLRQSVSIYSVVLVMAAALYFGLSSIDYYYFFNREVEKHKFFLPNQVQKEIWSASKGIVIMNAMSMPVWLAEVRGHGKFYNGVDDIPFFLATMVWFFVFTDACIYFVHRILHWPWFYANIHKEHHSWKIVTPWSSIAFHPVDGFSQSLAYHVFVLIWPMNRLAYLVCFFLVQVWSISIHDQVYITKKFGLNQLINGADHHTEHHTKYTFNYGQYFTFWDKLFGSHFTPSRDATAISTPKTKTA